MTLLQYFLAQFFSLLSVYNIAVLYICDYICIQEFHYRPRGSDACLPCDCYPVGSFSRSCDLETGQCQCRPGVIGRQCNTCDSPFAEVTNSGCEGENDRSWWTFPFIIISRECEHFPECQDKPDKIIVDFYMCVSVFVCLYIVFNFLCCSSSLQSFTTVVQRPSLRASGGLGPNSTFLLQFPAPKAPSVCYHFNIDWLYFYTTGTGRCH